MEKACHFSAFAEVTLLTALGLIAGGFNIKHS
jgi:hypothetical protein